ncbi:dienelactone hydrolase family protein [Photobacterium frigidiphilum]|jgi:dienelactone hydrolase|uniref:dienelactone hydrolase family protein n=1 Tax=Photobacterium frigidiphilum TaxID=264736 RepID=UPI003D0EC609
MKKLLVTLLFLSTLFVSTSVLASQGESVSYQVNGEEYEGFYMAPKKGAPLILMVHDWDGLTAYEKKRVGMLTDEGYAVFAADLFGKDIRPTETEEKKKLTGALYQDKEKMLGLLDGALEKAASLGAKADNTVAMGYCFGGAAVLEMARSGAGMKAYVTFHGGLKTPEGADYAKTKGKVLVFHGGGDTSVTMADFADLSTALEASNVDSEMIVYSGAPHGFTVEGSDRYQAAADQKSWARFVEFLAAIK